MFIDSHCHLNSPKIAPLGTPDVLVQHARAVGVSGMVTICCRITEELETLKSIADQNANVWCTVGTHPHDASREAEKALGVADIVNFANEHPRIVGIGESGLDYFYDFSTPADQAESFRRHIRACVETGLPLIVHARDADEDIIRILREEGAGKNGLKGVMHCFSSGAWMAEQALEIGFYLSFSGIVTFKNAGTLREICKRTPLERLLIETDAPYLAPEPHRKLTNEPALLVHTAKVVGDLHGQAPAEIGRITTQNFFTLFSKAKATWKQVA